MYNSVQPYQCSCPRVIVFLAGKFLQRLSYKTMSTLDGHSWWSQTVLHSTSHMGYHRILDYPQRSSVLDSFATLCLNIRIHCKTSNNWLTSWYSCLSLRGTSMIWYDIRVRTTNATKHLLTMHEVSSLFKVPSPSKSNLKDSRQRLPRRDPSVFLELPTGRIASPSRKKMSSAN